jgi:hypothetical protein
MHPLLKHQTFFNFPSFRFRSGAGNYHSRSLNSSSDSVLPRFSASFFSPPIDSAGNGAAAHGGPRRVQLDGPALVAAGPAAASSRRHQWRPRLARLLPLLSSSSRRGRGRSARPGRCFLTVYDTGKPEYKSSCINDVP